MFDGTELSLVYGDMQEPEMQQQIQEPPQKIKQQPLTPPPEAMYQQQQPEPKVIYKEPQVSFWDKLGQTRGDVFKLFLFALVILIAIAFDRLIFTYLKYYIENNMLDGTNEFIIRLAYPVGIIVVIWLLKSI
ncbi:hypothetical protein OAA30_00450 [bacterium]|nr:hypothetical protein [bacterium]